MRGRVLILGVLVSGVAATPQPGDGAQPALAPSPYDRATALAITHPSEPSLGLAPSPYADPAVAPPVAARAASSRLAPRSRRAERAKQQPALFPSPYEPPPELEPSPYEHTLSAQLAPSPYGLGASALLAPSPYDAEPEAFR